MWGFRCRFGGCQRGRTSERSRMPSCVRASVHACARARVCFRCCASRDLRFFASTAVLVERGLAPMGARAGAQSALVAQRLFGGPRHRKKWARLAPRWSEIVPSVSEGVGSSTPLSISFGYRVRCPCVLASPLAEGSMQKRGAQPRAPSQAGARDRTQARICARACTRMFSHGHSHSRTCTRSCTPIGALCGHCVFAHARQLTRGVDWSVRSALRRCIRRCIAQC